MKTIVAPRIPRRCSVSTPRRGRDGRWPPGVGRGARVWPGRGVAPCVRTAAEQHGEQKPARIRPNATSANPPRRGAAVASEQSPSATARRHGTAVAEPNEHREPRPRPPPPADRRPRRARSGCRAAGHDVRFDPGKEPRRAAAARTRARPDGPVAMLRVLPRWLHLADATRRGPSREVLGENVRMRCQASSASVRSTRVH